MAINNINGLIDLENLERLQNSDYVTKYYNTALANQGQRWTNEVLLEYLSFNIDQLIKYKYNISGNNENPENTYLCISSKKTYNTNEVVCYDYNFKILGGRYSKSSQEGLIFYDNDTLLNDFDNISEDTIDNILYLKKVNILKQLYYSVICDIKEDKNDDINNITSEYYNLTLYIPINIDFEYVSDGINKSIIYGSNKDIYVYVSKPVKDIITADDIEIKGKISIYPSNIKYIKTCAYHFSFEFKNNVPLVQRQYVLPFIDENNHWWINNVNTYVNAKAENATNLNIIIAYLYKSGNSCVFNILSGLNKYVIKTNVLEDKEVYIKRHNGNLFKIICNIPKLEEVDRDINDHIDDYTDKSIIDILENSTILLMTRVANLSTPEDVKKEYKNGLITTIWKYVQNPNGGYGTYEYLSIEDGIYNGEKQRVALNFSDITNLSNLLNYTISNIEQIEPDNYFFRHIVFDQILQSNKQETSLNYAYPMIQNIKGSQYDLKYVNNFNFSLRYVNNVIGTHGDIIDKGTYNSSIKYFKINDSQSSSLVTNSLYHITIDNQTNYYPEYLPNYNIPVFDVSEVLIKDSNIINRQNILSFANDGNVYYSYIGTVYDSPNKKILHIGTSSTNINLGDYSMINNTNRTKFSIHDTISIDFNNIQLNGISYIGTSDNPKDLTVTNNLYVGNINWSYKEYNSSKVYSAHIIPKFKYFIYNNNIVNNINIDNMNTSLNIIYNNIKDNRSSNNTLNYINIILKNKVNNVDYIYKYNDLIYIPDILDYIGLSYDDFKSIISYSNQIIYDQNNKAIFFVSSNSLLAKSINISVANNTDITINIEKTQDIYIGNTLEITRIEGETKSLIINEHQSHKVKSIWKLPNKITIS